MGHRHVAPQGGREGHRQAALVAQHCRRAVPLDAVDVAVVADGEAERLFVPAQQAVDGVEVDSLRGKELRRYRRKVGMIFQSFNLVTRSTAIKNVLTADVPDMPFFKVLFGIFSKEQKMHALESLDKVGILDKAYTRCDQLSGGQQQRVALARTLNQNPKIILADEPVASLDPITAKQVMQDFVRINKEYNISILLNIHHVDLALKYCDRVIGIRAGEIVFDGPASTITQEQIDEVYNGAKAPTMGEGEGEIPQVKAEG